MSQIENHNLYIVNLHSLLNRLIFTDFKASILYIELLFRKWIYMSMQVFIATEFLIKIDEISLFANVSFTAMYFDCDVICLVT